MATISAYHCSAKDFESTDWNSILLLYDNLLTLDNSLMVILNRAIALSKIDKLKKALGEFYYVANPIKSFDTHGPFALGVNWELGDLMPQFMFTNAKRIAEGAFITQNRYNFTFKNPNLNFGFNVTYVIHFKRSLKK